MALRIFHTHVLPYLARDGLGLPKVLAIEAERLRTTMLEATERRSATILPPENGAGVGSKGRTKRSQALLV